MRLPGLLPTSALCLGAIFLTSIAYFAKSRSEQEQIRIFLKPYVKEPVSFKLYRPDNHLQYYIEDLFQIQVSSDFKELLIVRHTPRDDLLRLPIELAKLEPNQAVMLLTHRHGNLYRIYLHPKSFMLTVVSNLKNVLAMESGVKLSQDQVQHFKEDPLYQGASFHL